MVVKCAYKKQTNFISFEEYNKMKIALVTGVAGGIGLATAELLLKNGVAVVGMDVLPAMPKKLEGRIPGTHRGRYRSGDSFRFAYVAVSQRRTS